MATRRANAKAMHQPAEILLTDLEENEPASKVPRNFKNREGKLIRKANMRNFDSKVAVGAKPYKNYADWEKSCKWQSDQWSRFDLQKKLYDKAYKDSGSTFYSMSDQDSFDVGTMPMYPLDVEKDILDDFTVVLIGRRRSGKTWLARWMAYHLRYRFPFGIVITGTKLNNFWSQYVPDEFIYDVVDIEHVLDRVYARQAWINANPQLGIDPRMFIILDDVMANKYTTRFSKQLSEAFTNGRHNDVFTLVILQDAKGIPPDLRENTDLCVSFRVYEGGRKEVIYKEWLSYIKEMKFADYAVKGGKERNENENENEKKDNNKSVTKASVTREKNQTVAEFFWRNTGLMDKKTCTSFAESSHTTDEELAEAVPQAIAILQARTTEDLQKVFKKVVAEDPGEFLMGDKAYYDAAVTGNFKKIMGTYPKFKRRAERRVRKYEQSDSEEDEENEQKK